MESNNEEVGAKGFEPPISWSRSIFLTSEILIAKALRRLVDERPFQSFHHGQAARFSQTLGPKSDDPD